MKRGIGKRIGSGLLALAMTATMYVGAAGSVLAGDTYPYLGESASGENQPYQHGYRVEDLMNWSPETDPYAEYMRARVPLQNRNEAFAATQADPSLSTDPQYLTLTGDYGNSFFNSNMYGNEFSTHVFNFWQYVDQYASWHGVPSVGTPEELNDIEDEEFARNELDNASSDKQKRIPKNGGGGTVFCNCTVDIHTINNYSSNSNMSEVGYYLRSILKELREFEKLMATNSALEERLSNVEKTLSALLHREDKD